MGPGCRGPGAGYNLPGVSEWDLKLSFVILEVRWFSKVALEVIIFFFQAQGL